MRDPAWPVSRAAGSNPASSRARLTAQSSPRNTYVTGSGRLSASYATVPGPWASANASTVGLSPVTVSADRSSVAGVSRPRVTSGRVAIGRGPRPLIPAPSAR